MFHKGLRSLLESNRYIIMNKSIMMLSIFGLVSVGVISAETYCEQRLGSKEEAKIICEKGHQSCCLPYEAIEKETKDDR